MITPGSRNVQGIDYQIKICPPGAMAAGFKIHRKITDLNTIGLSVWCQRQTNDTQDGVVLTQYIPNMSRNHQKSSMF